MYVCVCVTGEIDCLRSTSVGQQIFQDMRFEHCYAIHHVGKHMALIYSSALTAAVYFP